MAHDATTTGMVVEAPTRAPSTPLAKLSHFFEQSAEHKAAGYFGIGDSFTILSGVFSPHRDGSLNKDKIKSGLMGLTNSLIWAMGRKDKSFDDSLRDLHLLFETDKENAVNRLREMVHPEKLTDKAIQVFQDKSQELGSASMALGSVYYARSGFNRLDANLEKAEFNGGATELMHGTANTISYGMLAAVPAKGLKPEDGLPAITSTIQGLQYHRSQIASYIDTVTTGLGFLTAAQDLIGRKTPFLGGLFQLFASLAYTRGTIEISNFDKATSHKDASAKDNRPFGFLFDYLHDLKDLVREIKQSIFPSPSYKASKSIAHHDARKDELIDMSQRTAAFIEAQTSLISPEEKSELTTLVQAHICRENKLKPDERDFYITQLQQQLAPAATRA